MKRKSTQYQEGITGKARVSSSKQRLIKKRNKSEEKEQVNLPQKSPQTTPGSTRSKQESSLVSSKTKSEAAQALSYLSQDIEEDIPDEQYNEMLKEISRSLNFDIPSKQQNKKKTIKDFHQNKYEKYSAFQYDHSLHKEISIEIHIEFNNSKHDYYKEIEKEIERELMAISDFVYYEFSNVQNYSMSSYSKVDYADYEHLYQRNQIINDKMKQDIKEINLLTSLSSLYQQFLHKEKSSFYVFTPMHSFLFSQLDQRDFNDDEDDSDKANSLFTGKKTVAVLSSTLLLDKQLESNRITFVKVSPSKKPSDEEMNNSDINSFDKEKFNSHPALVEGYYITLLYNMLISEYANKTFNLISPFPFEGATYRQTKIKVASFEKKDKGAYVICINVFGCIFEAKLREIIKLLSKNNNKTKLSKTSYTYSMKLERIASTCEFFALNSNLSHSIERVEYKDNEYYLK